MTRTRIYLVRHGQVAGHAEKRYNGQGEVPLTPQGEAQFGMLRARLAGKPVKAVYSSDLERCLAGARMLGEAFELQPVAKPDLRELHIGDWEGKTWSELQATHPQEWQARLDDIVHYRVPNGENLLDLADRVRPRIREIIIRHHGEEVIVVAHGGVNRVILLDAIGAPLSQLFHLEQDFGCLNIIDYYADGVSVVKMLNG
jgi:alpha-ribazole phosphatase/probable phosphoglycerate mutase